MVFLTVYTFKHRWIHYKLIHVIAGTLVILLSTLLPHIAYFRAIKSTFYYYSGIPIVILAAIEGVSGLPLYFHRPYKVTGDAKTFFKKFHKILGFIVWFSAIVHAHYGLYQYMKSYTNTQ